VRSAAHGSGEHAERHRDPWIWLVIAVGAVLAAIVLASMI